MLISMNLGPQDHGWCAGYTCQRRLSLFHGIVALNKMYEVYFTGTSPQNLRLMLLNVEHNKVSLDRNTALPVVRVPNCWQLSLTPAFSNFVVILGRL